METKAAYITERPNNGQAQVNDWINENRPRVTHDLTIEIQERFPWLTEEEALKVAVATMHGLSFML